MGGNNFSTIVNLSDYWYIPLLIGLAQQYKQLQGKA